jgi:hypothetical protein
VPRTNRLVLAGVLAVASLIAVPLPSSADDCILASGKRVYASADGLHGFFLTHRPGTPTGMLFSLSNHSDKQEKVWERRLVASPGRVFVSHGFVVTVDMACRAGWQHSLIVYGRKGQVLADYKLEDLLSVEEINERVMRSVSSRNWTQRVTFEFETPLDGPSPLFKITLPWGRVIVIRLATGEIQPSGRR